MLLSAREAPSLPADASLNDYIRFGLENNPGLQAKYQEYQAALEKIPQARSLPDPKVMATHFVEDIQTRTGPQRNQLFVSQMFPWFGKLRQKGEVASKDAEAIYFAYEAEVLQLAYRISEEYHDYAYLGKATHITDEILELLSQLEDTVRQKVRGGTDLAPLLRLEVELAKTQDQLQAMKKQRRTESAALKALLGLANGENLPWPNIAESHVSTGDRAQLIAALLESNPELKSAQRRIDQAAHGVKLSKLSPIPDPTIGVGIFDTGEALSPAAVGSGDDPWAIQLSFSIPLWSGKYKAEKREAQARYEAAKHGLTDRENRLIAQLDTALQTLSEIEDRLVLYNETLLPKARQAVEVAQSSYAADRSTLLDFIDSERTLLEIERNYWRAVANYYKTLARLQTLTGELPQ